MFFGNWTPCCCGNSTLGAPQGGTSSPKKRNEKSKGTIKNERKSVREESNTTHKEEVEHPLHFNLHLLWFNLTQFYITCFPFLFFVQTRTTPLKRRSKGTHHRQGRGRKQHHPEEEEEDSTTRRRSRPRSTPPTKAEEDEKAAPHQRRMEKWDNEQHRRKGERQGERNTTPIGGDQQQIETRDLECCGIFLLAVKLR